MAQVAPFLMFEGRAQEAMDFYVSLFDDGEVLETQRYGPQGPGAEGTIVVARFRIGGQTVMCSDSPVQHAFTFTPSISLFVTCANEEEIRRLAAALDAGEKTFMPLGSYGFSRLFAWVGDRFGVTWQLNLP
jgi:predicted 3-demethylubiquinone-9 3-methyltransferase (glyoxalase superfamily)